MTAQLKINITGKSFSLVLCALVALSFAVLVHSIPDPGHGGDSILVSIDGQELTLQEAIEGEFLTPKQSEIDYSQCIGLSHNCPAEITCPENYAVTQVNRGESCGFWNKKEGQSYPTQVLCCKIK